MLPAMPKRMSSSLGSGFSSSSAFAIMMMPGVQKPHCAPPCFIMLFWIGFDDLGIAGAAADIAGDAEPDIVLVRIWILIQQRLRHHDDARRAEAALRTAMMAKA